MMSKIKIFLLTMLLIGSTGTGIAQETEIHSDFEFLRLMSVDTKTKEQSIVVRFRGNNITQDWANFVRELYDRGLVTKLQVTVKKGENPCAIYKEKFNLPGCGPEVVKVFEHLNDGVTPEKILADEKIFVPDVPPLTTFEWGRSFDKALPEDAREYKKLISVWGNYTTGEIELGPITRVLVQGWQLELSDVQNVSSILDAWNAVDITRANVILPPANKDSDYFSTTLPANPITYFDDCREKKDTHGHRGNYYELLSSASKVSDEIEKTGCSRSCEGTEYPLIVLVDDSGVYNHPDIKNAILSEGKAATDDDVYLDEHDTYCPSLPFEKKDHHGTHMAGIMVSREKDGAHFAGLAQTAKLYPFEWKKDFNKLEALIERLGNSDRYYPVYVFAGKFSYNQEGTAILASDGDGLKDENIRLDYPSPAKTIRFADALWVTAVGQVESGKGDLLRTTSRKSPMNLGDQKNILVVTACKECTGPNPTLWKNAHKSSRDEGLVNVAAPGGTKIPSTATNSRYAVAQGTSQAAAYVGGLAAQMIACYPETYCRKPERLKERLQVTAKPFHQDASEKAMERVTGGIVDPEKALWDPTKDWLISTTIKPGKQIEIKSVKWIPKDISVNGMRFYKICGDRIRRILKINENQWIMFRRATDSVDGKVIKFGPGTPHSTSEKIVSVTYRNPDNPNELNTEELAFNDIQDLLLKITSDDVLNNFNPCGP